MEKCGTPAYIAPEILQNRGYEGYSADIWSAGVVLFAMLYGTVPFKAGNMGELHKLIMKGKYKLKPTISNDAQDLLKKILEVDPKKRLTIPQILCHKWFSDYEPNTEVFTKEEKEAIKKEFTYNPRQNRNQMPSEPPVSTVDSDWFVEQSIDSSQSDLNRNITSKSIILAPFNSTMSHESDIHNSVEELIVNKRAVKLSSKVKDVDKQYEKNNNCEVDNGVYNEASNGTQNSEAMVDFDPLGNNDGSMDDHKEYVNNEPEVKIQEEIRKTVQEMLLNSLKPKPLIIDNMTIKKISKLGYPEEYVIKSLKESLSNYAPTTYYLIVSH